jgi:hypothetical protein
VGVEIREGERRACSGDFPFSVILAKDERAAYGSRGGVINGADAKVVDQVPASGVNLSAIGDLIGGIFGGFTKSIGS